MKKIIKSDFSGKKYKNINFKLSYKKNIRHTQTNKKKLIIVIRGHIRESFDNNALYNFLSNLRNKYNLFIFIHTWNIKNNAISWRKINEDINIIDENIILNYFRDIEICKILIDNENDIVLNGELEGNIKTTLMPIKGWKNMWYGMNRIISYISKNLNFYELSSTTFTLNIRVDYFFNSTLSYYTKNINDLDYLNKIFNFESENILFLTNAKNYYGIDNIYFGKFYKIFYTTLLFHTKLDNIINYFNIIHAQERMVYLIQPFINKYCIKNIDDVNSETIINYILLKLIYS